MGLVRGKNFIEVITSIDESQNMPILVYFGNLFFSALDTNFNYKNDFFWIGAQAPI